MNILILIQLSTKSLEHAIVVKLSKIWITRILSVKVVEKLLKFIKIALYFILFDHRCILFRNAIQTLGQCCVCLSGFRIVIACRHVFWFNRNDELEVVVSHLVLESH